MVYSSLFKVNDLLLEPPFGRSFRLSPVHLIAVLATYLTHSRLLVKILQVITFVAAVIYIK